MSKFRVGDKLKVTEGWNGAKVGEILICVEDTDGSRIDVMQSNGHKITRYDSRFELVENGRPKVIDRHIVIQDDCDNIVKKTNSFAEAKECLPDKNNRYTVYRMVPVAKIENAPRITLIKQDKKTRKYVKSGRFKKRR